MIRIEGLEKSYGNHKVLKGVSFGLRPGLISSIAGPNACGKTTLIKCVLGLAVPDHGTISLDGKTVNRDFLYRRDIGYMPQVPDFPPNLTLDELLCMLEDIRDQSAPRKAELLKYFELESILDQPFGELSGGTKQKVAAIAAFMFDPKILILDEPTVGLDPISSIRLKNLIREAKQNGKTILLVSHIMTEVEQLVDDMVFLLEGATVFSGSVAELKEKTGKDRLEDAIVMISNRVCAPGCIDVKDQKDAGALA